MGDSSAGSAAWAVGIHPAAFTVRVLFKVLWPLLARLDLSAANHRALRVGVRGDAVVGEDAVPLTVVAVLAALRTDGAHRSNPALLRATMT
jgi:hypothetical protein